MELWCVADHSSIYYLYYLIYLVQTPKPLCSFSVSSMYFSLTFVFANALLGSKLFLLNQYVSRLISTVQQENFIGIKWTRLSSHWSLMIIISIESVAFICFVVECVTDIKMMNLVFPTASISRVFFPPQFRESDSPCITSAVCPVFSLWTTCTQRSWTGRGCRTLCQRSSGSGRAGGEICNTRENTSCMYST